MQPLDGTKEYMPEHCVPRHLFLPFSLRHTSSTVAELTPLCTVEFKSDMHHSQTLSCRKTDSPAERIVFEQLDGLGLEKNSLQNGNQKFSAHVKNKLKLLFFPSLVTL